MDRISRLPSNPPALVKMAQGIVPRVDIATDPHRQVPSAGARVGEQTTGRCHTEWTMPEQAKGCSLHRGLKLGNAPLPPAPAVGPVYFAREDEQYRIRRKSVLRVLGERRHVRASVPSVESDVVARDGAASVHANEELVEVPATMAATRLIWRNAVDAPESPGLERQIRAGLSPDLKAPRGDDRRKLRRPPAARPKRGEIGRYRARDGQNNPAFRLFDVEDGIGRDDGWAARCAGRDAPQAWTGI